MLAETGESELAVAAFEGALRYHDEYPDVHYHLARTLDELGRASEADLHWTAFLSGPDSPGPNKPASGWGGQPSATSNAFSPARPLYLAGRSA